VIRKLANAFIPGAAPSHLVPADARSVINRFNRKWGGLWVGGTVSIAPQGVSFTPNRIIGQSTQRWSRSTCPPKTFGR